MAEEFTSADLAYLAADFFTLEELCAGRKETPQDVEGLIERSLLPKPSYVLDDGTRLFPADYFSLLDQAGHASELRARFAAGHRAAGGDSAELEEDWRGYLDGLYGVCLRWVSPETIARKGKLVESIAQLLDDPAPEHEGWRSRLRRDVSALDGLERAFAPDYDRRRFGRPPTRDLLIAGARERHPDVFAR